MTTIRELRHETGPVIGVTPIALVPEQVLAEGTSKRPSAPIGVICGLEPLPPDFRGRGRVQGISVRAQPLGAPCSTCKNFVGAREGECDFRCGSCGRPIHEVEFGAQRIRARDLAPRDLDIVTNWNTPATKAAAAAWDSGPPRRARCTTCGRESTEHGPNTPCLAMAEDGARCAGHFEVAP